MITPGQKLQDGDYVKGLTLEEWDELIEILDSPVYPIFDYSLNRGMMFGQKTLLHFDYDKIVRNYQFSDFKQLCENTFGG